MPKISLPTTPQSGIYFAMIVSVFLAFIKFAIGIFSGSLAVLASALDSLLDISVSGVDAFALWLSEKKPNQHYAYGFGKIQGFAAMFEGCIVFSTGAFLVWQGYDNFITRHLPSVNTIEITAMLVAIIGTGMIVWNFFRLSKIHNSLLIRSDALHYSSDFFMNIGILIALLLLKYLGWWWADAIFALVIGLWILYNAIPIIWNGVSMLLDRAFSDQEIAHIEETITAQDAIESFHYLKTRRSGDQSFIEGHLVFRDKNITLKNAHDVSEHIEEILMEAYPGSRITFHLDIDGVPEFEGKS